MGTVPARKEFVYPHPQQGLMGLLRYALDSRHLYCRQWATAIPALLARKSSGFVYRCSMCGGWLPHCRCWE
jgi:hypothetical protein